MGRLSHFTRLALGRSAFEDPIRNNDGTAVVNSYAFDTDAAGYVQSFDERGHPTNEASVKTERRLRRAQNEILQVVGVVRRKHDQQSRRRHNHALSASEALDMVTYENVVGSLMRMLWPLPIDLSAWWITSYRYRLTTFRHYLEPGLMSALRRESKIIGTGTLLASGLPYSLAADEIRDQRHWLIPTLYQPNSQDNGAASGSGNALIPNPTDYIKDFLMFTVEWPIRAFATLQRLGLIAFSQTLSWNHMIPFVAASPMQFPSVSMTTPWKTCGAFLLALVDTPFVLAYLGEQLRAGLGTLVQSLIHQAITKPTHPDELSINAWVAEGMHQVSYSQQGFNMEASSAPLSFKEQLRLAFPAIYRFATLLGIQQFGSTTLPHRQDILQAAKMNYSTMSRDNSRLPEGLRQADDQLRRSAMELAFAQANIDPRDSEHDVQAWADDVSTATPDMQDLLDRDNSAHIRAAEAESFNFTVPTETHFESQEPFASPTALSPPTPLTGGSRTPSVSQASSRPTSRPRRGPIPVRRPTELDDNISAIASSSRDAPQWGAQRAFRRRGHQNEVRTIYHRVTSLSTFPADSLAYYSSTFITSVIMLPFDVYYTRRLVHAFLASSTSAGVTILTAEILPARPMRHIFSVLTWSWCSKLALTFVLEAVAKSIAWFAGARLALMLGNSSFLWGKA